MFRTCSAAERRGAGASCKRMLAPAHLRSQRHLGLQACRCAAGICSGKESRDFGTRGVVRSRLSADSHGPGAIARATDGTSSRSTGCLPGQAQPAHDGHEVCRFSKARCVSRITTFARVPLRSRSARWAH